MRRRRKVTIVGRKHIIGPLFVLGTAVARYGQWGFHEDLDGAGLYLNGK